VTLPGCRQALLRAALADPLNQKFVLMSESGIPLYPPTALWSALMSERLSRINVCNGFRVRLRRPRAPPRDSIRWWKAERGRARPIYSAHVAGLVINGGVVQVSGAWKALPAHWPSMLQPGAHHPSTLAAGLQRVPFKNFRMHAEQGRLGLQYLNAQRASDVLCNLG
jgi:hypothetical protein